MSSALPKFTLYIHTFPNNKVYIGITSQEPTRRWGNHGQGYKQNPAMWNAIIKYGWQNIKHEILYSDLTEEQANTLEIKLIAQYNSTHPDFGYNIWPGGLVCSGWKHSEESKQKMAAAFKGKKYPDRHSNKGQRFGRVPVFQYDLEGNFINQYTGYYEASKNIGIPEYGISDCANGLCKTYYGFTFAKELLTKEQVLAKIKYNYGRILIYCYDKTGLLLGKYKAYREIFEAFPEAKEGNLSDCLNGRIKTYLGYVFSKTELTTEEVLSRYIKKKRKNKYKFIAVNKKTNETTVYNSVEDMAAALDTKPTVLRNVINGAYSKLHESYTFIKELNNEN